MYNIGNIETKTIWKACKSLSVQCSTSWFAYNSLNLHIKFTSIFVSWNYLVFPRHLNSVCIDNRHFFCYKRSLGRLNVFATFFVELLASLATLGNSECESCQYIQWRHRAAAAAATEVVCADKCSSAAAADPSTAQKRRAARVNYQRRDEVSRFTWAKY